MKTEIIYEGGKSYLSVDGKRLDPLAFKSFRPTENNVGDFYKAGVRLFHVYVSGLPSGLKMPYSLFGETWFGVGDYRFENFDRQMEFFLQNAPDGYVFVNLHVDVRPWWLEENPGNANSFTHLAQIAGNEKWRRDTEDYIRAFVSYAEKKYGDRIVGYWLLGGFTTEWFSRDGEETHPVKLAAFRAYRNDPEAQIPALEARTKPADQIFLDPVEDEVLIDYRRFYSRLIADAVLGFCRVAKLASNKEKLIGVFFGYIMELRHTLWPYGHLDLDRVNRSEWVDMIATPSSYRHRLYDDGSAYMILTDSLTLGGKMYFASFDNLTFLTPDLPSNPRRLCHDPETEVALEQLSTTFHRNDLLNTREKTVDGMRREMMARLAKGCGTWWFDMLEGWYYDDGLMDEVARLVEQSAALTAHPASSASEICVLVGSEPLYYVNPNCGIHNDTVVDQRGPLSRMGAPYDLYSLADLERIKKDYKLYIFLHAYTLTNAQRSYIENTLKKDGRSLLFVGPADYVNAAGFDLARTARLTEMTLGILDKSETTTRAFHSSFGYEAPKSPTFFVDDEKAETLGRFADSRKCSLAVKNGGDYRIFYSAVGNLSHEALREIARMAGVHIYAESGVFTYVNDTLLGVYNTGAEKTLVYPKTEGEYRELFSGKKYRTEQGAITLPTGSGPAQMLILK